jgi:hypothetical protein
MFLLQVDDAFISTPLNQYDTLTYYTANITDYIAHEAWQAQVSNSLPAGSDIRSAVGGTEGEHACITSCK